jgi:hypothetical protein
MPPELRSSSGLSQVGWFPDDPKREFVVYNARLDDISAGKQHWLELADPGFFTALYQLLDDHLLA